MWYLRVKQMVKHGFGVKITLRIQPVTLHLSYYIRMFYSTQQFRNIINNSYEVESCKDSSLRQDSSPDANNTDLFPDCLAGEKGRKSVGNTWGNQQSSRVTKCCSHLYFLLNINVYHKEWCFPLIHLVEIIYRSHL